jgi:hypothetical protein
MTQTIGEAVDALLDQARRLQFNPHGEARFDDVDLDGADLREKLLNMARVKTLVLDDIDLAVAAQDEEHRAFVIELHDLHQKCNERRDDLKVYYVINTADRRLTVLACDAKCARQFAYYHGHIKDQKNGRVLMMKPEREAELRKSGQALGRALRDGWPGVVTQMGSNVVMEGTKKVYTPMTIVE